MKVNNKVLEDLEEHYSKADLHRGYLPYIRSVLSHLLLPPDLKELVEKKQPNKQELVTLSAMLLSSEELFREMLGRMPDYLREFLEKMVWEESFLHEDLANERYDIDFVNENGFEYGKPRQVKAEFHVFAVKTKEDWRRGKIFFLGIPPGIRAVLSEYFEKPEGYYLKAVEQIPEFFFQFNGEETIFQELQRILAYASQGNIKLNNAGLPVQSTFNKMRKTLSLKEFYEGWPKPYDALRSALMATLISDYGIHKVDADPLQALKDIFHFFKTGFYPIHLLNYLKGLNKVEDNYKIPVGKALMDILADFPEEEGWVNLENIRKYASFRSLKLHPVIEFVLSNYLYIPVEEYGFTGRIPVSYHYHELVKEPLLKAGFWLFAAFGLVEAAYMEPEEEPEEEEEGYDLSTPYDPLCYVRLTPLGAYLSGRVKDYKMPQAAERTAIQLLDDSLHILSEKPDETLDLLLDNYTIKTGPSRYRTDFKIFMKGVRNGNDLDDKIRLFRQTVADELPANWEAFFQTLRLKCNPLKSIGEHSAYQLSPQDQELMHLVAKDPVLKKLVIKAEGLIILVMKKDGAKFKSRLKEFGYLLE